MRYVERNPVRARIVRFAENYEWSSAAAHRRKRKDSFLSVDLPLIGEIENWSQWLREEEDRDAAELLRRNRQEGIPCGSEEFIAGLESLLKRFLRFRPPWRPKKRPDLAQ